ncbi:helix-turn-helix transcriptional regulator [Saccharopolyspora hirsuta]|uniref:Helix-turn-helix transcriptional regulator n=1 Tax=Saccharopolyspora hirsuta TaxID=1837 RepID=A0A5M7C655_SACHI|nr:helix-turn-helix transcriptional regulator [Saccharopolyspora hirsuta]KAA5836940.1 helix-turn-helix transcriptional regulator [Saccharopolyspora hirsuta]
MQDVGEESEPLDPDRSTTRDEFTELLNAARNRAGLSYAGVERAAKRLPPRSGHQPSLARSTLSDMLTGKRAPNKTNLEIYLLVCGIAEEDLPRWMEARKRVWETAPKPEPKAPPKYRLRTVLITSASALALGAAAGATAVLLLTPDPARGTGEPLVPLQVATYNWTHWTPDPLAETRAGEIWPGTHAVACWTTGVRYTWIDEAGTTRGTSDTWLRLATDYYGNRNVYISDLMLAPTPKPAQSLLPRCP